MVEYFIRRLCQYLVVFFIILIVVFVLPRLASGNPADFYVTTTVELGEESEVLKAHLIERFGLNKSLIEQFSAFLLNTFTGYLGVSWIYYPKEVTAIILERLPWTLFIVIASRILAVILAYFVGVIAAWKHGGKVDSLLLILGLASSSVPAFWIGMIMLFIFSFYFPIFPLSGAVTPGAVHNSFWEFACDVLYHGALPILTLSLVSFFSEALLMRNTMVGVLREDFILTAEAKGLDEITVMFRHAARNSMLPFVTQALMSLGILFTGVVFTETVFSYPGMGLLLRTAIFGRDFPLVQGILVISSVVFIAINFITDLIYMWLDPRIRLGRR
ncbi:MAG: ABC transporter permease [Candidatus Bathyarchaeia archaeon]